MRPRRFCSCSLAAAQEGEVELMRNGSRVRKNLYVRGDKHGLNWIDTTIQLIRHHVAPSVCMHGIGIETKIGQRCACLHMCIPTSKVPVRPVDSIDVILATHATSVSLSLSPLTCTSTHGQARVHVVRVWESRRVRGMKRSLHWCGPVSVSRPVRARRYVVVPMCEGGRHVHHSRRSACCMRPAGYARAATGDCMRGLSPSMHVRMQRCSPCQHTSSSTKSALSSDARIDRSIMASSSARELPRMCAQCTDR
jgi:hypothetical protein